MAKNAPAQPRTLRSIVEQQNRSGGFVPDPDLGRQLYADEADAARPVVQPQDNAASKKVI